MPILPLLENVSFDPEQIKIITSAYEKALHRLRALDADPPIEALAKSIIAGAQNGEQNPDRLCESALRNLGPP
jgi:vacuolar-type H+-ATPase subunit E/Vma4